MYGVECRMRKDYDCNWRCKIAKFKQQKFVWEKFNQEKCI